MTRLDEILKEFNKVFCTDVCNTDRLSLSKEECKKFEKYHTNEDLDRVEKVIIILNIFRKLYPKIDFFLIPEPSLGQVTIHYSIYRKIKTSLRLVAYMYPWAEYEGSWLQVYCYVVDVEGNNFIQFNKVINELNKVKQVFPFEKYENSFTFMDTLKDILNKNTSIKKN
jgi:hypothetical protein